MRAYSSLVRIINIDNNKNKISSFEFVVWIEKCKMQDIWYQTENSCSCFLSDTKFLLYFAFFYSYDGFSTDSVIAQILKSVQIEMRTCSITTKAHWRGNYQGQDRSTRQYNFGHVGILWQKFQENKDSQWQMRNFLIIVDFLHTTYNIYR